MNFNSAIRVAAATAASTEAPGAAAICTRYAGYRPVIALTASNTETWTMAIVRTAIGVTGCLDAMSAAFAFASVTTSASALAAPRSITAARTEMQALIGRRLGFMSAPTYRPNTAEP